MVFEPVWSNLLKIVTPKIVCARVILLLQKSIAQPLPILSILLYRCMGYPHHSDRFRPQLQGSARYPNHLGNFRSWTFPVHNCLCPHDISKRRIWSENVLYLCLRGGKRGVWWSHCLRLSTYHGRSTSRMAVSLHRESWHPRKSADFKLLLGRRNNFLHVCSDHLLLAPKPCG